MDKETNESVTIIVKSPYQLYPDQNINCSTEWTVLELKEEIYKVHPNHPSVNEQKLIYWGKLMENQNKLKDTLKIYEEGQANHTVHLIIPTSINTENELRHRKTTTSTNSSNPQQSTSYSQQSPFQNTPGISFDPRMWSTYWMNQQQMFIQQSQQYMMQPPVTQQYQSTPQHQQSPQYNDPASLQMMQQYAYMQQAYAQYMTQYMNMFGATTNLQQNGIDQQQQQQQQGIQFNNLGDNAPEEERPRDWIDLFYISTRVIIFVTIICFYSSPFRFLLVLSIGFAIYLYQSGFFRYVGPAVLIGGDHNNNNINDRPNNNNRQTNVAPNNNITSTNNTNTNQNEETVDNVNQDSTSDNNQSPRRNDNETIATDNDLINNETEVTNNENATVNNETLIATETQVANQAEDRTSLTWNILFNFFTSLLPDHTNFI